MSGSIIPIEEVRDSDQLVLMQGSQIAVVGEQYLWHREGVTDLSAVSEAIIVESGASRLLVLDLPERQALPDAAELVSQRSLLFRSDQALLTVGKASQFLHWVRSHRFCGFCGSPTKSDNAEMALICASCGHHFFPRISPCVIMLVVRGREILLARNARYRSGFYSCLAGFIEAGESAEDTVHREVKEESGLDIENVRYFKSQSWPFPSQLMLGFYADYKSGDIVPEEGEIEEADWFDVDELPTVPPPNISIAGELISHYVEQMKSASD